MIAHQVSEFTKQTLWDVMESNINEVLTVATLLKEQVVMLENQNGRITG